MERQSKYDWKAIQREYRAGQFSIREISRNYGPHESSIRKRAKNGKWTRDLADQVNQRVDHKLSLDEVREKSATDDEIIEAAAERGANIVRQHRKDIAKLAKEEQRLMATLETGTKLYITQYQGGIVERELALTATEQAAALNALANVQQRRIALERQAYNLGESSSGQDELTGIEIILVKPDHETDI